MRKSAPNSECVLFLCGCDKVSQEFCMQGGGHVCLCMCVKCLRIRQQHVSLHKYWQESFGLFGIFLRKLQQYSNTSSLLFTRLFQLLAPGNPYCFNQYHLEWWHVPFFLLVTDTVHFLMQSSHERFLCCAQYTQQQICICQRAERRGHDFLVFHFSSWCFLLHCCTFIFTNDTKKSNGTTVNGYSETSEEYLED